MTSYMVLDVCPPMRYRHCPILAVLWQTRGLGIGAMERQVSWWGGSAAHGHGERRPGQGFDERTKHWWWWEGGGPAAAQKLMDKLPSGICPGRLAEIVNRWQALQCGAAGSCMLLVQWIRQSTVTADGSKRRGELMGTAVRDCSVTCRVRVCSAGARVPHGGRLCRGQLLSKGGETPLHAHPTCHRQLEVQCAVAALAVARSLVPAVLGGLHEAVACFPWHPQPCPVAVSTAAICT